MISGYLKNTTEEGVSPVVGVVLLVAVTVVLSAIVLVTVGAFAGQSDNARAGVNVDYESESVISVQLNSMQHADKVLVESALGSTYELNNVGDSVQLLNLENEGQMTVIGVLNGEKTVLQTIKPHSFKAEYTVGENQDYKTIGAALDQAYSNRRVGEIIVLKKGVHNVETLNLKGVSVVGESGTIISSNDTIIVGGGATLSNVHVKGPETALKAKSNSELVSVSTGENSTISLLQESSIENSNKLLKNYKSKNMHVTDSMKSIAVHSQYNDMNKYTFDNLPSGENVKFRLVAEGSGSDVVGSKGYIRVTLTDGVNSKEVPLFFYRYTGRYKNDIIEYKNYERKENGVTFYNLSVPSDWDENDLRATFEVETVKSSDYSGISLKSKITTATLDYPWPTEYSTVRLDKKITGNQQQWKNVYRSGYTDIKEIKPETDLEDVTFSRPETIKEMELNVTLSVPNTGEGINNRIKTNGNSFALLHYNYLNYVNQYKPDKNSQTYSISKYTVKFHLSYDSGTLKLLYEGEVLSKQDIGNLYALYYKNYNGNNNTWVKLEGTIQE